MLWSSGKDARMVSRLYIAFKVGWSVINSDNRSQSSSFGIFRFFTTDEKKLFSSFAAFPQSVTKNHFLQLNSFFLKTELYLIKTVWLFPRNVCYRLFAFRSVLRSNLRFPFRLLLFFKKRFRNLVLVMITLGISLFMKGLWFDLKYRFLWGVFLSRTYEQISKNVSSPFSSKTFFLLSKLFS